MSNHVVIIGAGIGGLATANILAKAGYTVSVYEKNTQPGGRAGIKTKQGFTFDTGPSWYLMPGVFEQYFSLFGTSANKELNLVKLNPAYKVFYESEAPITITGDEATDVATFNDIEQGAGLALKEYVKKGNEIYQLSLRYFLYTNFSRVRDLMKKDIMSRARQMAALALTPIDPYVRRFVSDIRLRQILEYPMVFLGSSPFSAPALYSLMSALDFQEGVYYPRGGIYTIIEKMVTIGKELGVTYHYDTPVQKIITKNGDVRGVKLADATIVMADIVISNADLHFTETSLLDPRDQSYPKKYWKKHEAGPSALLMYLGVKGELPQLEHHNLFFVKKWEQNFDAIFHTKTLPKPASIYICKPSATDPTVAPKGHENVFALIPLPPGINISDTEKEIISDMYLQQIEKHFKIPDLRDRLVVKDLFWPNDFAEVYNAWQGTALGPSHILRQSAFFRTPNKSKKVKNLYYVGGFTTPGIGLPMCLISAELAYKRITGDKKSGPLTHITSLANTGPSTAKGTE